MSGETNPMLAALAAIYGEPDSSDVKAFLAVYSRLLRKYTRSECEEAAELLLSRRKKYKTWPVPADCIEVLDEVRKRKQLMLVAERAEEQRLVQQQAAAPKTLSAREQRELERFVDEWADGKRRLQPAPGAKGRVVDTGMLSSMLRKVAQQMQARRRARA